MLLGIKSHPELHVLRERVVAASLQERWPVLATVPPALAWLEMRADLGIAPSTLNAYALGLAEYLAFGAALGIDSLSAGREHIARFVRHLTERPSRHAGAALSSSGRPFLSNATVQQRLTAVRLFYDHLVEDSLRDNNPVGRGRYAPNARIGGGNRRGLVPRQIRLPWIPNETDWRAILETARHEPIRNRTMLALGYDAGLRREELCSLRTDDFDPGHRLLRVRAETTKGRRERVAPYSAVGGELLRAYLAHRAGNQPGARPAVPIGVSAQPRAAADALDLVQGRAPNCARRRRAALQHAHTAPPLPDRPCAGWVGAARHRHLRRAPRPGDNDAVHPPFRPRARRQTRARHGADP